MNERVSLDRFEGAYAVLIPAEGEAFSVPCGMLDASAREGMLLYYNSESGRYCPDEAATAAKQAELKNRVAALLARQGRKNG